MKFQTRVNNALGLDYKNDDAIWIKKGKTVRRLIGILGMALPLLLYVIVASTTCVKTPLESISHYYYTNAGAVFTVILSFIAIFLIVYSGLKSTDFYVSTFAGVFAMFVVLFPTGTLVEVCSGVNIVDVPISEIRAGFHIISAGIFISLLAYMSLCLFTKSDRPKKERTKEKHTRNLIYKVCGVLIIFSLLVMVAGFKEVIISENFYETYHLTFWMETLAVECFGIAWLIKGETLFKDKVQGK